MKTTVKSRQQTEVDNSSPRLAEEDATRTSSLLRRQEEGYFGRFLAAKQNNQQRAEKAFEKHLAWIEDKNIDRVYERFLDGSDNYFCQMDRECGSFFVLSPLHPLVVPVFYTLPVPSRTVIVKKIPPSSLFIPAQWDAIKTHVPTYYCGILTQKNPPSSLFTPAQWDAIKTHVPTYYCGTDATGAPILHVALGRLNVHELLKHVTHQQVLLYLIAEAEHNLWHRNTRSGKATIVVDVAGVSPSSLVGVGPSALHLFLDVAHTMVTQYPDTLEKVWAVNTSFLFDVALWQTIRPLLPKVLTNLVEFVRVGGVEEALRGVIEARWLPRSVGGEGEFGVERGAWMVETVEPLESVEQREVDCRGQPQVHESRDLWYELGAALKKCNVPIHILRAATQEDGDRGAVLGPTEEELRGDGGGAAVTEVEEPGGGGIAENRSLSQDSAGAQQGSMVCGGSTDFFRWRQCELPSVLTLRRALQLGVGGLRI